MTNQPDVIILMTDEERAIPPYDLHELRQLLRTELKHARTEAIPERNRPWPYASRREDSGVTVTAVCPGPVPTEFQAANDAQDLVDKLPGFTHVSAERVVPGGPQIRLALGPTRFVPTPVVLPVVKRMLKR